MKIKKRLSKSYNPRTLLKKAIKETSKGKCDAKSVNMAYYNLDLSFVAGDIGAITMYWPKCEIFEHGDITDNKWADNHAGCKQTDSFAIMANIFEANP